MRGHPLGIPPRPAVHGAARVSVGSAAGGGKAGCSALQNTGKCAQAAKVCCILAHHPTTISTIGAAEIVPCSRGRAGKEKGKEAARHSDKKREKFCALLK